jgi:hypothetical protein
MKASGTVAIATEVRGISCGNRFGPGAGRIPGFAEMTDQSIFAGDYKDTGNPF